MFQPNDPTAEPDFQIDTVRSPFFQILQIPQGSTQWAEVGFVWTIGSSRLSSTENWYLYDSTPTGTGLAPYFWPGYNVTGKLAGTGIRLEPATVPEGQTPATLKDYLQRSKRVTITYIKGTMAAGDG